MAGDMELARTEVDEGVSVPRQAIDTACRMAGEEGTDVRLRGRFAAAAALALGWVAFEDLMLLVANVGEEHREGMREAVHEVLMELLPEGLKPGE